MNLKEFRFLDYYLKILASFLIQSGSVDNLLNLDILTHFRSIEKTWSNEKNSKTRNVLKEAFLSMVKTTSDHEQTFLQKRKKKMTTRPMSTFRIISAVTTDLTPRWRVFITDSLQGVENELNVKCGPAEEEKRFFQQKPKCWNVSNHHTVNAFGHSDDYVSCIVTE